ncbi:MAG: hypothetical protein AAFY17_03670 [Cyanobacteria bacterium J06642_11]
MSFEETWKCVSQSLAEAVKIIDQKGKIAPEHAADFLLLPLGSILFHPSRAVYLHGHPS